MNSLVDPDVPDGVARTSGGAFDRTDAPVYFLATNPGVFAAIDNVATTPYVLVAVNDLGGPRQLDVLRSLIDAGCRVLLDSGVFWLTNQHARKYDVKMDAALGLAPDEIEGFPQLYDRYCSIVSEFADGLWGAIEVDQGGAENKRVTRARLMADVPGFVPIPVYHPVNDGDSYFAELAEGFDRICAGNVVQASYPDRVRLMRLFYDQRRAYPYLWIHALGYTPTGTTASTPVPSCDSSSWVQALRWNPATVRIRSMLQPQRSAEVGRDYAYNRGPDVAQDSPGGITDAWQWSAYRAANTWRTWRLIEAEKERLQMGERHMR